MSLETARTARFSSGTDASQAPVASTIAPASTEPDGVRTIPAPGRGRPSASPSKILMPRACATRRRPRASGRLNRRSTGLEHGAEMDGRARAPLDFLGREKLERLLARAASRGDRAFPGADLRRRRRRPEPATALVVRVDALPLAERAELVDGLRRDAHEAERLLLPRALDERLDLRPPREREPAVAPGGPPPQMSASTRTIVARALASSLMRSAVRSRVAAADDTDVGLHRLEQLRGLDAVFGRQRLAEPERAGCHPRASLNHGFGGTVGEPTFSAAGPATGSRTRNVVPWPSSLVTSMAPRGRGRWRGDDCEPQRRVPSIARSWAVRSPAQRPPK